MNDYTISDSGVRVWNRPEGHPLLRDTDLSHPKFRDKLTEVNPKGRVKGLPRILSENSEDALTWYCFSPLLRDSDKRLQVLKELLYSAFPGEETTTLGNFGGSAELVFWPKLSPPDTRSIREGLSEPDLMITSGRALILVEAKFKSCVSTKTSYDDSRDQVIRLLDVGSWHARSVGLARNYVIVLQYGDAETNSEDIVGRYRCNPEAIRRALPYRTDLTESDFQRLSGSISFVRWPDPWRKQTEH